jgi:hypothetical protein
MLQDADLETLLYCIDILYHRGQELLYDAADHFENFGGFSQVVAMITEVRVTIADRTMPTTMSHMLRGTCNSAGSMMVSILGDTTRPIGITVLMGPTTPDGKPSNEAKVPKEAMAAEEAMAVVVAAIMKVREEGKVPTKAQLINNQTITNATTVDPTPGTETQNRTEQTMSLTQTVRPNELDFFSTSAKAAGHII